MSFSSSFAPLLVCPDCFTSLKYQDLKFICSTCKQNYPETKKCIYFRHFDQTNQLFDRQIKNKRDDGLVLWLKAWAKQWPYFFQVLYKVAAPFIGQSALKFASEFSVDQVVLNLGSGAKIVKDSVINVDYDDFPAVKVVADINSLPFGSDTVDGIICESVFEHLVEPQKVVKEIARVLKSGGRLYVVTPFMLGYHSSPKDYYRWTEYGMRKLLEDFEIKEFGAAWGPTTAVFSVGGAWLSLILSFGWGLLYQIWLVFFIFFFALPNRLDHLLKYHPRAIDNAHGLYFIAVKK